MKIQTTGAFERKPLYILYPLVREEISVPVTEKLEMVKKVKQAPFKDLTATSEIKGL